jgi:flagellar basal body-associated protein FliL
MFLSYFTLFVALSLSAIAAWYSIIGLTAIFAAAAIPIIIMGGVLEVAKITITVWLHEHWHQARWLMKLYLVPAVVVLMIITSMGIFGFLSKAHLDQSVPTGDVAAQVSLIDERIKTQRDNIDAARAAIKQMDDQVNERLARSTDDRGAERAVQIRRQQARERAALQNEIAQAQAEIARLNEQRAPIASELRAVEAKVGPIKYIAALIYGDNPDSNLLERAVRWMIILLVIVFDPLAIMMVLAATQSLKWHRESAAAAPPVEPLYEPDDGPLTNDQLQQLDESVAAPEPKKSVLEQHPYLTQPFPHFENIQPMVAPVMPDKPVFVDDESSFEEISGDSVAELPENVRIADTTYGARFPENPKKGDLHVRTDYMPTQLYKYIGTRWIEIYKNTTDSYAYNSAYIDFLIEQIEQGAYDPDLLTDSEREQISTKLRPDQ